MLLKIFILHNTNKINVHGRSGILLQQHSNIRFRCGGGGGAASPSRLVNEERATEHFSQNVRLAAGRGGEHFYC